MDKLQLKGEVEIIHRGSDGKIKKREKRENLIVNIGKEQIAKRLIGTEVSPIGRIHLGTGTNAPSPTDTALVSQTHAQAATVSYEADYKVLATALFNFTSSHVLAEAGLFSSAATPVLYSRININYSVQNGDTLTVNWRILVS